MHLLIAELFSQPGWISQGCFDNVPPPPHPLLDPQLQTDTGETLRSYGAAGGTLPFPVLGCTRDGRGAIKTRGLQSTERAGRCKGSAKPLSPVALIGS